MKTNNNQQLSIDFKLKQAMYSHNYEEVKLLITMGADPNTKNSWGSPLIFWCAEKGRLDLIDHILNHGAKIDIANKTGETALHRVSFIGKPEVIEGLVSRGAKVNKKNMYNSTPLYIAAYHGQANSVKTLLKLGADPTIANSNALTPYKAALSKGFDHIATIIENHKCLRSQVDNPNRNPGA